MGLREIARELNEKAYLLQGAVSGMRGPLNIYWKILFIRE
jgi:hypothetical protein